MYDLFFFFKLFPFKRRQKNGNYESSIPRFEKFGTRFEQVWVLWFFCFKLITILSLIFHDGDDYCFCFKCCRNAPLSCLLFDIKQWFWNYKEDLKKHQLDPVFLSRYRNKLFPYLIECYMIHEPSIACFAGGFL